MTHPATAEGIYQGMASGMLAARALRDILERDVPPEQAFSAYERACRHAFTASFRGAAVWQWLVDHGGLDAIAGILNHPFSRGALARVMARM
jgi:flavin-dependent dehydrogenase